MGSTDAPQFDENAPLPNTPFFLFALAAHFY